MQNNLVRDENVMEQRTDYRTYCPNIQSMMQELLRTLANFDFQHEDELNKLKRSATDEELKKYIKEKLLQRHRERREPYVNLLAELRKQQHLKAFAA